jgi:hypothetical protein
MSKLQSNQIILKNFGAQPSYTVDPSHGVKVTAGESCGTGGGSGGSSAALAAFAGGLFTGNPLLAATSILFAGMPCAFAQDSCSNEIEVEIITTPTAKPPEGTNTCDGKKLELDNTACSVDGVVAVLGQGKSNQMTIRCFMLHHVSRFEFVLSFVLIYILNLKSRC